MLLRFETLGEVIAEHGRDDHGIGFVEGVDERREITFGQLRERALATLGALQRSGLRPGDTAILSLADNARFLELFWACVLGGIVPVPLAPAVTDEQAHKVVRVFTRLGGSLLLADDRSLARLGSIGTEAAPVLARARLAAQLDDGGAVGAVHRAAPSDTAFVQFSSGSTGDPKGVLLSHANLAANIEAIAAGSRYGADDIALSWMPLSHDMGLIGFHLNMVASGVPHAIMRTDLFARRPLLWLEEATRRGSTVLCSPNFGYQHVLRQVVQKAPQGLDLSAVRLVYNGAEPISPGLCRRFLDAMAPHGLRRESMFTVYGLAEATLAVTFPRLGAPLATVHLDPAQLSVGAAVREVEPGTARSIEFVRLGRPVLGMALRIVDAGGDGCGDGVLGRIEVRGGSVSAGYWRDPEATARNHGADGWVDTGDLGFLRDGELVVTGRAKDIVFVNGRNVYPHDIERIAAETGIVETNRVAAAGIRIAGDDGEALALFVLHRGDLDGFVAKAAALRRAIQGRTGLELAEVVPVAQIPKTTSGKLQRYGLAEAHARGDFDAVRARLRSLLAAAGAAAAGGDTPSGSADGAASEAGTAGGGVLARLVTVCARLFPQRTFGPSTDLLEADLGSLELARLHEALEAEFQVGIDVADLLDHPVLERLAAFLARRGPSVS